MDDARVFLNDTAASLYTNAVLLEPVKFANRELEKKLVIFGVEMQKVIGAVIAIDAGVTSLEIGGNPGLPTDFLLPIELKERTRGDNDQSWQRMEPREFEPSDSQTPTTTFGYYAFRNNKIYFPAATGNRDILLKYERLLAAITSANSPEDNEVIRAYLAARTAEFAARYIGQNDGYADKIALREVSTAEDDLMRMFTLHNQNNRVRRPRFRTQ